MLNAAQDVLHYWLETGPSSQRYGRMQLIIAAHNLSAHPPWSLLMVDLSAFGGQAVQLSVELRSY
jgi:hypothetical protein